MKETRRCPKCERQGRPGTNVLHFDKVDDLAYGGFAAQALAHGKGLFPARDRRGLLEAYVCNDCGYLEYYITDYPLAPPEAGKHD